LGLGPLASKFVKVYPFPPIVASFRSFCFSSSDSRDVAASTGRWVRFASFCVRCALPLISSCPFRGLLAHPERDQEAPHDKYRNSRGLRAPSSRKIEECDRLSGRWIPCRSLRNDLSRTLCRVGETHQVLTNTEDRWVSPTLLGQALSARGPPRLDALV